MLDYKALNLMDGVESVMNVKKALSIYKKWNLLTGAASWGEIPIACTSAVCSGNSMIVCASALLWASAASL